MPAAAPLRPAHLSAVALFLILWHGVLAGDYLNTRFELAEDVQGVMALLPVGPLWSEVGWAMSVWLGLAGALFLLFRDDAAVLLLFAAAVAMLVALGGLWGVLAPEALTGWPLAALLPALALVPLAGWLYARGLKRRGLLH
ncbi:MAG: hypothetical protein JJT95_19225 [Pararhodobacter sp.]|nr:hypothetical protein [Pararhodobacter sp.]